MTVLFPQSNTLNQLNAMFAEIANDLAVYNSYGEGEVSEIGAITNNHYPLLWCEVNPVNIYETYTTYNYRLYSMDLVFADLSNRMEVQSDALSSLHHVLYRIRDHYNMAIEWNSLSATPFIQMFNDLAGGWYIDVKIQIPWSLGSCDIPLKVPFSNNILDWSQGQRLQWGDNSNLLWG